MQRYRFVLNFEIVSGFNSFRVFGAFEKG